MPEPSAAAEILLSELLGIGRGEIPLHSEPLTGERLVRYEEWISRRLHREPVQRILGYAYFRNLKLELNDETLIPRADTESVVDAVLECVDRRGGKGVVLDVGTGSGAIAIAVAQERPLCKVYATDNSAAAIETAHRNAGSAGVEVDFRLTDLGADLEFLRGGVEVLVSNPPYIKSGELSNLPPEVRNWDQRAALDGGPDGLVFYRRIFAELPPLLRGGADVVLEIGDGQAGVVAELGRHAGFIPVGVQKDLTGAPRALILRWEAAR